MKKYYIVSLCILISSCISFDTSMQLAKTLPKGETSTTVATNFNIEHDESVFKKRFFKSFDSDYNKTLPRNGFAFAKRWGVDDSMDWGLSISLKESSVGLKYNYFNMNAFSFSFDLKVLVDVFSFDSLENYALKFGSLNSYQILDNLSVYINPSFIYYPVGNVDWKYIESSFGLVIGREYGLLVEYTYREPIGVKFESSLEQLSFGLVTNVYSKDANISKENKFMYIAGQFSTGLEQNFLGGLCLVFPLIKRNSLEISYDFGIGRTPTEYRDQNRQGWRSYDFARAHYRGYWSDTDFSYVFGTAYKSEQLNIHLSKGWHRFVSRSVGVEGGFGYRFENVQVDPLLIYIPVPFVYSYSKVENMSEFEVFEETKNNSYARRASKKIDFVFFKTQIFL